MISTVILSTYVLENYGDPTKPWWKPKGGYEYALCKLEHDEPAPDPTTLLNGLGDLIAKIVTRDNPMFIEMTHSISLVPVAEASRRLQLSYDDDELPLELTDTAHMVYTMSL